MKGNNIMNLNKKKKIAIKSRSVYINTTHKYVKFECKNNYIKVKGVDKLEDENAIYSVVEDQSYMLSKLICDAYGIKGYTTLELKDNYKDDEYTIITNNKIGRAHV